MPVVASTFRWTQEHSVNIAVLDQQHQALFETVNELDRALRVGEGNSAMDSVLKRLVNYAEIHFASEESLMEQHEFPGLFAHRAEHAKFRQKLGALLGDYRTGTKPGVPVSLVLFLRGWLKEHVQMTDKRYSAFLNARGVR